MESKEYQEGYNAFWDEMDICDNPYSSDESGSYNDWRIGWFDAYLETK